MNQGTNEHTHTHRPTPTPTPTPTHTHTHTIYKLIIVFPSFCELWILKIPAQVLVRLVLQPNQNLCYLQQQRQKRKKKQKRTKKREKKKEPAPVQSAGQSLRTPLAHSLRVWPKQKKGKKTKIKNYFKLKITSHSSCSLFKGLPIV